MPVISSTSMGCGFTREAINSLVVSTLVGKNAPILSNLGKGIVDYVLDPWQSA
jgi:hypothetical protein